MTTPSAATGIDVAGSTADLDRLRVVLLRIARRIRTSAPGLITMSQMSMLGTVMRHGPCTISAIAEIEHVRPPSASKIIASLEEQNYVTRQSDPADRRCSHIVVTPTGRDLVLESREAGRGWLAVRMPELDDSQLATLSAAVPVLEQLLGNYDEPVASKDPDR